MLYKNIFNISTQWTWRKVLSIASIFLHFVLFVTCWVVCVTIGLAHWLVHHCVYNWRQWVPLSRKLSVADSSVGRDRVQWAFPPHMADCRQGLVLCKPGAGNFSCSDFRVVMAVACPEMSKAFCSLSPYLLAFAFFLIVLLQCYLSLRDGHTDVLVIVEHSTIIHSQYLGQLGATALLIGKRDFCN